MSILMKNIIFWVSVLGVSILIDWFWLKTSIKTTVFAIDKSPIYFDIILVFLGLNLAIPRFISLLKKIF